MRPSFITDELIPALTKRRTCAHTGETRDFCSNCGKDLRITTSLECRICSMLRRPAIYTADRAPNFCPQCGAPKFTFKEIKKKKSRN